MPEQALFDMSKAQPIAGGKPLFDMSKARPVGAGSANTATSKTPNPDDEFAINPMTVGPLAGGVKKGTMRRITSALPLVGAGVGAAAGEGLASIPGAAIGASGGESLRQLANRFFGIKDKKTETSMGAAEEIGKQGVEQAAIEAATMGAGKALEPAAKYLKESAAEGLGKVLAPTTKANKRLALKTLPRMVEESPIAMTRSGLLDSTKKSLATAGDALDDALANVPKGKTLDPKQIANVDSALQQMIDGFSYTTAKGTKQVTPGAEPSVHFIKEMKDSIAHLNPSFESVRDFRKILDGMVNKSGTWNATAAEGSVKEVQRDTANLLRNELAKAAPDVAKANKDYAFYKGMQQLLEATLERQTGQKGNLTRMIMTAGGVAGGGGHGTAGAITGAAVMNALSRLTEGTAWRTVSAATKSKIADLISSDQLGEAMALITRLGQTAYATSTPPLPQRAAQ